jgi:hypothetical protein
VAVQLFLIVVWLLTLALRNNGAHIRYWMRLTASIKFLIPMALVASLAAQIATRPAPAITWARPNPTDSFYTLSVTVIDSRRLGDLELASRTRSPARR